MKQLTNFLMFFSFGASKFFAFISSYFSHSLALFLCLFLPFLSAWHSSPFLRFSLPILVIKLLLYDRDCNSNVLHVLVMEHTLHLGLQSLHEVIQLVFLRHIFDLQHEPQKRLYIVLNVARVHQRHQLVPCEPRLIP